MTPPTGPGWAVELVDFGKNYFAGWTGSRSPAVSCLNLKLAPGHILGLLGPNGSGKSTTLKALGGLLRPSRGKCLIFGHHAGSDTARALVGYLPELPQFPPHLSGKEFLCYCGGLSSIPQRELKNRVDEILEWSGLTAAAERRLGLYSKGMQQRLGLAQAILHDPPLILLDEPASGLDPAGRLALNQLIRDLAARGKTVVFSSHLLAHTEQLCDRLAILGRGRILAEGTPAELLGSINREMPQPSRLEKLYLEKLEEAYV
jgi:ABC-type multidrug transport system ATPase subunit